MPSFIDLMADDVWSEADIKARLHAEMRSEVSEFAEIELNRALQGMAMGLHTLSAQEQHSLMRFKAATDRVALLGAEARADMALLHDVLALESAQHRLALPPVEVDADTAERAAAQGVVDAASPEALALCLLRNPAPEVAP